MNDILFYLKKILKENDIIIMATSGGPDSMALLHLLCELKDQLHLKIVVAHVNHKLRKESEEEALFVKNFSDENHLVYEYMEIKEYGHDNLENEARQKRYAFLEELAHKYHANYLFTAHHGDDLIETILMRLVRGSSLKGYSGFQRVVNLGTYQLIRPLIPVTKKDILKYMEENNYPYYIDQSNYSRKYTRNRYRMDILPFLKEENQNVHLKFLKFSQELNAIHSFINEYIKNLLPSIKNGDGIVISKLLEFDDFLIKKIIEYELSLIYQNDLFLVSDKNTLEIIKLLKSKKESGVILLPNAYQAIKEYNTFKIVHNIDNEPYLYIMDKEIKVPTGVIKQISHSTSNSNYVIRLNSNDITLPFIVRSRRAGDKMAVKHLNGNKKVKSIYIDEKISKQIRNLLPVVTDSQNQILWLPGVKKSKFDVETDGIYDIILSYEEE